MKVFKGKIWAALGSLMDHASAAATTASGNSKGSSPPVPDRALLADIEAAVERCTAGGGGGGGGGGGDDDHHVHEILFLVSNAPGAITFLSRRITARLQVARAPAAALRSLLLVHRLLRAGDRYFEQDLRSLWASRDLCIDAPRCSCSPHAGGGGGGGGEYISAGPAAGATGTCSFLHGYSAYLEERMQWVINQAGNLEPARPRPPPDHHHQDGDNPPRRARSSSSSSYDHAAASTEPLIFKLAMSQRLLDLAIQLLPDNNTSATSAAARSAFGIVLRESFKVYDAFKDGLDALLRSRPAAAAAAAGGKASRVSAHEILKKACAQTPELKEFYHKCKKSNVSKSLDYPVVRVITSAMELIMPPVTEEEDDGGGGGGAAKEEAAAAQEGSQVSGGSAPFATKLQTTISTVWVEFDDGDGQHAAADAGSGGGGGGDGDQLSYL